MNALAYIVLGLFALWALTLLALALGFALSGSRGEESGADDVMAVADAVAGDYFAKLGPPPGWSPLEGFTPLEAETLERNYLPMTDDERFRLDMAWRSIVEGADR